MHLSTALTNRGFSMAKGGSPYGRPPRLPFGRAEPLRSLPPTKNRYRLAIPFNRKTMTLVIIAALVALAALVATFIAVYFWGHAAGRRDEYLTLAGTGVRRKEDER